MRALVRPPPAAAAPPHAPGHTRTTLHGATRCRAAPPASPQVSDETRRAFDQVAARGGEAQASGAGGATTLDALLRADAGWAALCAADGVLPTPATPFVTRAPRGRGLGAAPDYDVAVVGGTLGALVAAAVAARGLRVVLVEGAPLVGRAQEWNICRSELNALVDAGCLSPAAASAAVCGEFNPVRAAFGGAPPYVTRDVLNLGVDPARLLAGAVAALTGRGGAVWDRTPLAGVAVHDDGVRLTVAPSAAGGAPPTLTARLVVDATGSRGPFVAQARAGERVDGACLVVGTCARAPWPDNDAADVIAAPAGTGAVGAPQYFWEAFPARGEGGASPDARTTYMFTYVSRVGPDAGVSLASMLDEYWRRVRPYQGLPPGAPIDVDRILFGVFTSFRASPLAPRWDRVLHAGDASGLQSPLSFGGVGALARHGRRVAAAVADAVAAGALDRGALAAVNPYSPSLSCAWMLQAAMSSSRAAPPPHPDFVVDLLAANFAALGAAGDAAARPFLRDTLQFGGLAATLARQVAADPRFALQIVAAVGPAAVADWARHYAALGVYTLLWRALATLRPAIAAAAPSRGRFLALRALDALEYGSGCDFVE